MERLWPVLFHWDTIYWIGMELQLGEFSKLNNRWRENVDFYWDTTLWIGVKLRFWNLVHTLEHRLLQFEDLNAICRIGIELQYYYCNGEIENKRQGNCIEQRPQSRQSTRLSLFSRPN